MRQIKLSTATRNTLSLSSASACGYAVSLLLTPLLTRVFDPDAFGRFALFWGLSMILGAALTLRLEKAFFLSNDLAERGHLAALTVRSSLLLAILAGLFLILLRAFISFPGIFFLLPLSAFLHAQLLIELALNNVRGDYLHSGVARGAQTGLSGIYALLFSNAWWSENALITGLIASTLTAQLLLWAVNGKESAVLQRAQFADMRRVASRHRRFPQYTLPHEVFAALSTRIASILLPFLFGTAVAGQFFMAQKLITVPCVLISSAASQVYFHELSKRIIKGRAPASVFLKAFRRLGLLSAVIFLPAYVILPYLIPPLLGQDWLASADFVRLLVPWAAVYLVASVLSQTPQACGFQARAMQLEMLHGALRISALFIGLLAQSPVVGIAFFLAVSLTFSGGRILWYWRIASRPHIPAHET